MKALLKVRGSTRAQTAIAIALIITLVTLSILIPVALWLTGTVLNIAQVGNNTFGSNSTSSAYNATMTTLSSNLYAAYSLSTILPIIAVAGVIIAAITGFIVWRRQQ